MHRFYCPIQNISGNKIIISDKDQVHHLRDVLRLKAEDKVIVFDEQGNEYNCLIRQLSNKTIELKIKARLSKRETKIQITVACAIPKKSRMDEIIDKLTQLGVDRIIPLESERVIIKLDKSKKILRKMRWEKIALSSSQQSQRNILPMIEPIKDIKEVLTQAGDFDLKLIPTLMGERKSLRKILAKAKPKNILVLIGPEGDFTAEEVDLAIKSGCIPVSLGDLVLRVETAAIAVTSFIKLYADR
jgi:16S rRNA (uracil1498-N3)-methyltransferase